MFGFVVPSTAVWKPFVLIAAIFFIGLWHWLGCLKVVFGEWALGRNQNGRASFTANERWRESLSKWKSTHPWC